MTSTPPPPQPWEMRRRGQRGSDTASTARFGGALEPEHGSALPGLSRDDAAAVSALPARSALMIVQRGPNAGARFLLEAGTTTVGRHPRSDIFLDDVTVSRHHCEFVCRDGGVDVRDVGSLNGTYVNRTRIETSRLRSGDEVQVGKYRLTFHPSPARDEG